MYSTTAHPVGRRARATGLRPGIRAGAYPQRPEATTSRLNRQPDSGARWAMSTPGTRRYRRQTIAARVEHAADSWVDLEGAALHGRIRHLRREMIVQGLRDELVFSCFALVRHLAHDVLGKRHYDEQLWGGWLLLQGTMVQMQTGEGKTLTATLPACTAALAGIPTHIVTANEYLAQRDAALLTPLFQRLGLSVGAITASMDPATKRDIYRRDIVYLAGKQLGFDYLRDRMATTDESGSSHRTRSTQTLLRGLCFAIVDEADSVLIDEASTPLIIAREVEDAPRVDTYRQALELAVAMQPQRHFTIDAQDQSVSLSRAGLQFLEARRASLPGVWAGKQRSEALVVTALRALHCHQHGRDYLVSEGRVVIIDPHSGRRLDDRSWPEGLQQLIEIKENCSVTGQQETLASISFQRLFCRYLKLAGMSGTLREVNRELTAVYGLQTLPIPPHKPCRRTRGKINLFPGAQHKWQAIVNRVEQLHRDGKPVLLGTASLANSESLSVLLEERGLPHQLLNARHHQREAQIIARAGECGQITIATQMAGRGTDIILGDSVEARGGLHVLLTEPNPTRRIDRQMVGRAGRQGDPGRVEFLFSLEDPLLRKFWPTPLLNLLTLLSQPAKTLPAWLAIVLVRTPQSACEYRQRHRRRRLLQREDQLKNLLAISGTME